MVSADAILLYVISIVNSGDSSLVQLLIKFNKPLIISDMGIPHCVRNDNIVFYMGGGKGGASIVLQNILIIILRSATLPSPFDKKIPVIPIPR